MLEKIKKIFNTLLIWYYNSEINRLNYDRCVYMITTEEWKKGIEKYENKIKKLKGE
jgi:hypothetical protein